MASVPEKSVGGFEVQRTYEPYSNDPDYLEGNRGFIAGLDMKPDARMLDLACGVCTLTELVWECHPGIRVVGLDLSGGALVIARDRLGPAGTGAAVDRLIGLTAASADAIPLADRSFDAVIMGHSIHMLPDEHKLLAEVNRVLKPGGLFAFNSSFYAGTFVEGTEQIYHDWIKASLTYIQEKDRELKQQGQPGIRRVRGKAARAFSKEWPSAARWRADLEQHGLRVTRESTRIVRLTQYSFETIGAYAGFAEVILSGYPVAYSCEALQATAGPTLSEAGVDEVPRRWLEIVAVKEN